MNIEGKNLVADQPVIDARDARSGVPVPDGDAGAGLGFDVHRIYSILRRNLLLFVGIVIVAIILGVIVTMLTTPKYTATGSVQIEQETARVLKTEDEPRSSGLDVERFLQTQTDIIRSRAMALRVARELRLMEGTKFFESMGARANLAELSKEERQELMLKLIKENLFVDLPRQSRIVTISFVSPDPELAARIVNTYSRAFIQGNLQRKYDSSSYARDFLARQLTDTKDKLEASERALNSYSRGAGLIRTQGENSDGTRSGPQSVTTASLVQLNEVANAARAARIAAEQKWNSARSASLLSLPTVLSNQAIQQLLEERATKTADLREERARHLDSHPSVQQKLALVAELDRQINEIATSIRNSIRDEYRVALQQERALGAQVSGLKNATLAEQDLGVRYNLLLREADTNRTMYDGLLQRFKELSASAGLALNNISVIDEAERPTKPSSPRLFLNLLLALFAGILVGLGAIFVRERIDDSIRIPEDAEHKLGVPVIGVIPAVKDGTSPLEELMTPRTGLAEAYHALRTSLIYSSSEGLPRSLLVTSSQASEGKSTTSFAIAHGLARLGKRVILVDTDLRRPSLHRVLGLDNAAGVVDAVTHSSAAESAIRPSGYENLDFVSSGPIPPNPTELLSSNRMREFLNQLHQQYEVIVFDGPPVLGLADAPILSALAEATVFVIESNRSHRGGAKAAIRRLRNAHSHILGCVLTKFDLKQGGTRYYAYEYYSYGADAESESKSGKRAAS